MNRRWRVVWGLCLTICAAWTQSLPFRVHSAPDVIALQPGESGTLTVSLRIPAGHYVYRDETAFDVKNAESVAIGAVPWPAAHEHTDSFTGLQKMVWSESLILHIPITAPTTGAAQRTITAEFSFQGCSPELCYRRETVPLRWDIDIAGLAAGATATSASHRLIDLIRQPAEHLFMHGLLATYLLAWFGGFLTGFTPCVLPMLPIVLLVIGVTPDRKRRNFVLASCLAAGLALTYAAIGLAGVVLGQPIGFLFGQRWFVGLLTLFFVAMSLAMFGVFHLQLPSRVQTRMSRLGGRGPGGAFLAGISTGVLATPCAGPVVAALVAHGSVTQDPWYGFFLLLTYGLGLGALFVLVGTFSGHFTALLPRGRTTLWIKRGMGVLLLLPACYYGWVLLQPRVDQIPLTAALADATATQRPLFLEFTAKTCLPCLQLERTTLQDPRVRAALAETIIPLRIDATFMTPELEKTLARYNVVGWPTLLFVRPDGTSIDALRSVGTVISADDLLQRIDAARRAVKAAAP